LLLEVQRLRSLAVKLEGNLFEVEDDVGHILDDARERREFVEHSFDANGGDGRPFDRREQDAPERVADRGPESTLKRLRDKATVIRGEGFGIVIELLGFLEI